MPIVDPPDDLVAVREAAQLVDRSVSTIRAWLRDGHLVKHREGTDGNARVLVSRADLLLYAAQGASPTPGRPASPAPAATEALGALRAEIADLRRDLAIAEARQAAAESVAAAECRRADAERDRATDARLDAERVRAELVAARAELEALRERGQLPWWRRLLGPPRSALPDRGEPDA